jgi:hypothetical protein
MKAPNVSRTTTGAQSVGRRDPIIQANGSEWLVTINGAVFLALSRAQAETIAYRMSGRPGGAQAFDELRALWDHLDLPQQPAIGGGAPDLLAALLD